MKVKELIQHLSHFDEDYEIFFSRYSLNEQRDVLENITGFKIDLSENRIIMADYIKGRF